MTIICALHEPGVGTWIGSDRQRSGGYRIVMDKSKFILRDGWGIGVTGWARASDVVANAVGPLPSPGDVWGLSLWLRRALEEDGFARIAADGDANLVKNFGTGFILASAGGVWDCDAGFATSPIQAGVLHARGSGADFALGADFVTRAYRVAHKQRAVGAVEAACAYDAGCGGEPWVDCLRLAG